LVIVVIDLDERMKTMAMKIGEDDHTSDTFGERAQSYYQKRPHLLALLQDLYNGYITLSDRYIQTLAKQHHQHHRRHSSQFSAVDHDYCEQEYQIDSDADSSLSYQQPQTMLAYNGTVLVGDDIVADLVIKNVEYDILVHETTVMERHYSESSRKIGLQKSLLEVLESERLILLNDNAKLGYRVTALVEENKGLASESMFMKRKASELARCVLKMREDHRVYMLNRKIEDLQGQIYGLEKRNKDYSEQLVRRDQRFEEEKKKNGDDDVALHGCFKMEKLGRRLKKKASNGRNGQGGGGKRGDGWWERMMTMDLFPCGLSRGCTS
jgi:hypothetical protein